jgi:macrocin-O-methyltransferase TylF-like protien
MTEQLLQKYPIISEQITRERLRVVLGTFEKILRSETPGEVVEFGCYIGTTSLFLRRLLDAYDQQRSLHVYDSFEGLPPKSREDNSGAGEQFKVGELSVSKKLLLLGFKKAGLWPPVVHKGWFSKLTPNDLPEQIAFAFLDGDFYDSILDSLKLVWPKLAPNAIVCVDDFGREALPGAERAVHDFLRDKQIKNLHAEHNIAIIET